MSLIGKFIQKGSGVWPDAGKSFTSEHNEAIKANAREFVSGYNFCPIKGIQRIKDFQMDNDSTCSHLWQSWGGNRHVDCSIDFNYSSSLELQQKKIKDKDKRISSEKDMAFVSALMCCDTPQQTIAFLIKAFAQTHGYGFKEMMAIAPKITKYAILQLEGTFVVKNDLLFARPSDYELFSGSKTTVSVIPHPDHGACNSGHSTIGKAVRKACETIHGKPLDDDFIQATEDVGLGRIDLGIHWFIDHNSAEDTVQFNHDVCWELAA